MYLALYRKYRPQTFEDVISQEHITTTLKNQIKSGQISHAYLFTGSRGTGKTTCAKILAKAVNCLENKEGNPCLECSNCRDIDDNSSDITEIDAASNNGVEYIRDLKEEAVYSPVSCKYRVYIIDEVHMLSIAAFNALLKLIEEPPPHVIFIFATTEVHKIPATILSRCQRFEFRRIDINDSKNRIKEIAEKENKKITDDAAFLISKISDGGMRDALSLLDQCFSVADSVDTDVVMECAGISGSRYLFELADRISEGNTPEVLKILDGLINRSKDVTRLCEEMISHYRNLMLLKSGADNSIIRATEEDMKGYAAQCEKYSLDAVMRNLSVLSETFSSLGRVKTPVMLVEMCFIRLCNPKADTDEKSLAVRIEALEKLLGDTVKKLKTGEMKEAVPSAEEEIPAAEEVTSEELPAEEIKPEIYEPSEITEPQEENPVLEEVPAKIKIPSSGEEFVPFPEWAEIIGSMDFSIRILIETTTAEINQNTIKVSGPNNAVNYTTGDFRQKVQETVSKALGRNMIIVADTESMMRSKPDDNSHKLKDFLEFAKSQGVNIKEQ